MAERQVIHQKGFYFQIALEALWGGARQKGVGDIKKIIDSNKFDNQKLTEIKKITDEYISVAEFVRTKTYEVTQIDKECVDKVLNVAQQLRSATVHNSKQHDFEEYFKALQNICEIFVIKELNIQLNLL